MAKVGIFFGTDTGNTRRIAKDILISKNHPPMRKMHPFSSFRQGLPEPRSQGWLS